MGTLDFAAGHSYSLALMCMCMCVCEACLSHLFESLGILVSFSCVQGAGGLVGHEAGAPGNTDEITARHMHSLSPLSSLSFSFQGRASLARVSARSLTHSSPPRKTGAPHSLTLHLDTYHGGAGHQDPACRCLKTALGEEGPLWNQRGLWVLHFSSLK